MALRQNISILMMPFHATEGHQLCVPSHDSIWSECQMAFDKGKLYTHIRQFLQPTPDSTNSYRYQYFSLSEKAGAIKEMLRKPMCIDTTGPNGQPSFLHFTLGQAEASRAERERNAQKKGQATVQLDETQESFFSPKLILCPNAGVGMLMLSIQLTADTSQHPDISQLIDLNYALFKTYPPESTQTQPILLKTQADVMTINSLLANPAPDADPKDLQQRQRQMLGQQKSLPAKQQAIDQALAGAKRPAGKDSQWSWNMAELTDRLMLEFQGSYERFDPYRLHVFTYLQVDQSDMSIKLLDNFTRILKLQNRNYMVMPEKGLYEQTFQNIYMGSTVEGGGIMTLLPSNNTDSESQTFIADFMNSSLSQSYLWTYMMVQMQRHTLLHIEQQLTTHKYLTQNSSENRNRLRKLITQATQNKVNACFIDISDHTQHNRFHTLCRRNMKVALYADSIEKKLASLKEYLEMLTDEQTELIAKRRTAIERWITIIGAVFALFSSTYDAYGLLDQDHLGLYNQDTPAWLRHCIILGSIAIVTFVFYLLARTYVSRKKK